MCTGFSSCRSHAVLPTHCCPLSACRDTLWGESGTYTMAKFVPFNPTDKYTIAFVRDNATGKIERVMKGAPQVRGCRSSVGT